MGILMLSVNFSSTCVRRRWLLIDAQGVKLGRLAAQISNVLRGKDKVCFAPNTIVGNNVIVINSTHALISGKKRKYKKYYSHTGFPGGLRVKSANQICPSKIIYLAVLRMLAKESKLSN